MKIKLSKDEVVGILKEKFNTTGDVKFVFKSRSEKAGSLDGVQMYAEHEVLDSIEIEVNGKIKVES